MSRLPRAKLLLGLILLAGLGLRLWGIAFASSTPVGRPDEEIFAVEALGMFVRPFGRLWTGWPDGFFRVWHAALALERRWYQLRYGAGVSLGCLLAVRPLALLLPLRVLSALLGTATAWTVGRIAVELLPERAPSVGLWATAIYAFNYLVGRDGHFGVTDPLLCFEIAATLLFCAKVAARGAWWLVPAGFSAGVAFSTKYSALGLLFPCAAAAVIALARGRRRAGLPIACAVLAAALGVWLVAPDIVTHWSEFRAGLAGHFGRYEATASPPGAVVYPTTVFPIGFGWPGLLLGLAGTLWCARQQRGVVLVVYLLLSYACVLGPLRLTFARYGSPLVPALAATGGVAAALLVASLRARLPRPHVVVAVGLLALAIPAARLVAFDRLLARPDTRDLARDWLVANGLQKKPDTIVWTEGVYAQVHAIDASVAGVCRQELPAALWQPTPILPAPTAPFSAAPGVPAGSVNARWLPLRLAASPAVAGEGERGWERIGFLGSSRYLVWEEDQRRGFGDLRARAAPDFLARAQGPRAIGWLVGAGTAAAPLDACWSLAARFSPGRLDEATWDHFDAFVAPLAGLNAVERPGPDISIYRNACKAP